MLRKWINHKHAPLFVGVLGVVLRLIWVTVIEVTPTSDAAWYKEAAIAWSQTATYQSQGQVTAFFPPAYPAFLALLFSIFGQTELIVKLAQVFLAASILFFSYQLANRWFNASIAFGTLFLLSFYPNHIAYCSLLLSETLFTAFLLGGFYFWGKGKKAVLLTACCWSLAMMCKPWLVLLPGLLLLGKRKLYPFPKIASVYLLMILFITIWGFRNVQQLGSFVPFSTNGGVNLLIGNNEFATGTYHFEGEVEKLLQVAEGEVAQDQLAFSLAKNYLFHYPWESISRVPQKIYFLFHHGNEGFYWLKMGDTNLSFPIWRSLSIAAQAVYLLVLASALLFVFSQIFRSHNRYSYKDSIIFCLLLIGIYAIFFGYSRYHFPMIPFLVMYAVGFWQKLIFVKK